MIWFEKWLIALINITKRYFTENINENNIVLDIKNRKTIIFIFEYTLD